MTPNCDLKMEPIAVVGIGCRFPKAKNPQSFWQLLRNGGDAITEVPSQRWDIDRFYEPQPATPGKMNTRWGGFLEQIDNFDPGFFGITPQEAEHMDPQQRLMLEIAWEALENAGIVPETLSGSDGGVFIGITNTDYHKLLYKNSSQLGTYSAIGTTSCIAANRLSYAFNLRGPSMVIDTGCSSSLVTVHLACQSLWNKESNLCFAGAVNLMLYPEPTISCSQAQMMSPDGRCKTFDASADGYVRGEGCGLVVLKRLSDAIKDQDNILALIRSSAVNQDGLSSSLSAPNGLAQQAVIRQALANAKLQPSDISYIEAHAVGTAIGDAIEFRALKAVLMEGRQPDQTCYIGSVKPNIGHLESASGIAGLIKVILCLQYGEIPPHLHLQELNPYISLEGTPFQIPRETQRWDRGEKNRFAGVSGFGFGGTNAHIILEEAPVEVKNKTLTTELSHHILTLSAKSDVGLKELAQSYEEFLASNSEISLADVCFTTNAKRTHFDHRLCVITESIADLRQQLNAFISDRETHGLFNGKVKGRKGPKIAFLFPGKGIEELSMGRELYETQPTFRAAVDKCAEILQPYLEKSFLENSGVTEPALFTIEYALAQLWQSWGIKPKVVMGYGVGEYVAAIVAGVFNLEDALKLVGERIRLMQASLPSEEMIAAFRKVATQIIYSQPQIPLISSVTGELTTKEITTAEYWCKRLQQPGKLTASGDILTDYQVLMGIPSKPTSLPGEIGVCLSSLRAGGKDWQEILHSLGELYIRGGAIDWSSFHQDYPRCRVVLPNYPFQRQRYWFKTTDEDEHEKVTKSHHHPQRRFVDLLHQVEIHQITQLLRENGNFSEAQIQLLPELVEFLTKKHRQQVNGNGKKLG